MYELIFPSKKITINEQATLLNECTTNLCWQIFGSSSSRRDQKTKFEAEVYTLFGKIRNFSLVRFLFARQDQELPLHVVEEIWEDNQTKSAIYKKGKPMKFMSESRRNSCRTWI